MDLARSPIPSAESRTRLDRLLTAGEGAVLELARRWNIAVAEIPLLTGATGKSDPAQSLLRMSHLLGIHRCLTVLFGHGASGAQAWLHAPNSAPLFGGARPIDAILDGDAAVLKQIRGYLECQLVV